MISRLVRSVAVAAVASLVLSACGGGGGGGTGSAGGNPVPTTSPPPPGQSTAFSCPSSASTLSAGSSAGAAMTTATRRMYRSPGASATNANLLAVTYNVNAGADRVDREIEGRASTVGAHAGATIAFGGIGRAIRLVNAGSADSQAVRAKLQSIPGVVSVSETHRLYAQTRAATFTNDPYFKGASGTAAPLYQTASTGGQWDMHVIGLEHAFSYSEGSTSVKLAVIDTGEDVTQREIAGAHIVRTQCYITNASGTQQSVGPYVTDPDGHGTDVTGIAAATSNNGYGFAGAAGHVSLMLYRVFPTPNDTCNDATNANPPPECSASDIDVASAINDAVANGANVINLSLGADKSTCTNGADPDTIEGNAIGNAIAHNVIVVAAAGNGYQSAVGPPACVSGVIAAGASAYNDGQPNGTSYAGSSKEYMASYSNYGATNTLNGASSWGIAAPGGDPLQNDSDSLHWIENIWTTTPYDASFAGACGTDPYGGANDCRILIAGTSMSTPHVAGAAALLLSINSKYQSPSAMKQLLCSTTDSIGDPHQGCGRLNVYRAAAVAAGDPNLP